MKNFIELAGGPKEREATRELLRGVASAIAMHGILANQNTFLVGDAVRDIARVAVLQGDALLKELET